MSWLASIFARAAPLLGKIAEKVPFLRPIGSWLSSNAIRPILSGLGVKAVDWAQEKVTEGVANLADSFRNRMNNSQIKPAVSQAVALYDPRTDVARNITKRNATYALEDAPRKIQHTATAEDFPQQEFYRDEPD